MAAGKPIIACADGETAEVIKESGCGFCARADNEKDLVKVIKDFIKNSNRAELGRKARDYYTEIFSREKVMDKLERILEENCRK